MERAANDYKVIYIAGYGRSGSTLLDVILGNHSKCTSLGEVANLPLRWNSIGIGCSCGKSFSECERWAPVIERLGTGIEASMKDLGAVSRRFENWLSWPNLLWSGALRRSSSLYSACWGEVFGYISEQTGSSFVVDSSNTSYPHAWRPLALSRVAGLKVKVIHLVRDSRSVMASKIKGNNKKLAAGDYSKEWGAAARGMIGWFLSNVSALCVRIAYSQENYMILTYEELVDDPQAALEKIERYLRVDFAEIKEKARLGEQFSVGHLFGGNRMAKASKINLRGSSKVPRLGFSGRLLHTVLGGWLQRIMLASTGR